MRPRAHRPTTPTHGYDTEKRSPPGKGGEWGPWARSFYVFCGRCAIIGGGAVGGPHGAAVVRCFFRYSTMPSCGGEGVAQGERWVK